MRGYTITRIAAGRILGSRAAAAAYTGRHENVVRRHCQPVACDSRTKALLFDLDEAAECLAATRRVA